MDGVCVCGFVQAYARLSPFLSLALPSPFAIERPREVKDS